MLKKLHFLCLPLIFLTLSLACAHAAPPPLSNPEKATVSETSSDGRVSVELTEGKNGRRETLVIRSGKSIYRVPDERLLGYNDDDSSYDHDFYLSPNAKWLFVTRKLFHTVDIGYLYHLEGKQFKRVRPQGLRFDEAAIRFFSHHLHFRYEAIREGPRIIYFLQWTADSKRLAFEFHSSKHYESSRYWILKGFYDLISRRFGLISYAGETD